MRLADRLSRYVSGMGPHPKNRFQAWIANAMAAKPHHDADDERHVSPALSSGFARPGHWIREG